MSKSCASVFVIAMILCATLPAFAATDQYCLKQCFEDGGSSYLCLRQCAYGEPVVDPAVKKPPQSHRVLPALTPLADGEVITPPKPAPPPANKDYVCMAQCLQNGGEAYQMCEQRCTKQDCLPGVALCRNQTEAKARMTSAPTAPLTVPVPALPSIPPPSFGH